MLAKALRGRSAEIEQSILTRAYSVSELPARGGPEYAQGLRAAVRAGVELGLAGIEDGESGATLIPEALLSQARLAARSGVSLDTVLRRYFAGHTLLEDFMVNEAEREKLFDPAELQCLLRTQAAIVDRLFVAIAAAYTEEDERRHGGSARRKAERIERLLGGEPLDTSDLGYDFDAWHLGLLASGPGALEALARLAAALDSRALTVRREEGVVWGWLGSKQRLDSRAVESLARRELPAAVTLATGEPGQGIAAWRLSHRQARAALSVAQRSEERVVSYARVALLASALGDELLTGALRELYVAPLEAESDGGALLQTLRAYFAAERNISSTAISVQADRKTVNSRLGAVERRLGRPIASCALELEIALQLEELADRSSPNW